MRITALPCVPGPRHEYTRYNVSVHLYYDINHVVRDIPVTMYTRHYSRASEAKRKGAGIIREIFKLDSLIACRLIYLALIPDSRFARLLERTLEEDPRAIVPLSAARPILILAYRLYQSLHSSAGTSRACDTSYRNIGVTGDDGR